MDRLILTIVALMMSAGIANAENWCETLINKLNATANVDKTVTQTRDPGTHKLTYAVYDYRFESKALYDQIWDTMNKHAAEAEYYSTKTEKQNRTVVMRYTNDGFTWNCKLQPQTPGNQFLVNVVLNSVDRSSIDRRQKAIDKRLKAMEKKEAALKKKQALKEKNHRAAGKKTHSVKAQDSAAKAAVKKNNEELERAAREREKLLK